MRTSPEKLALLTGFLLLGACAPTYRIVPAETYRKCRAYAESTEEILSEAPRVCRSRNGAIRVPPPLVEIPLR